jgi:hypothetical protein
LRVFGVQMGALRYITKDTLLVVLANTAHFIVSLLIAFPETFITNQY